MAEEDLERTEPATGRRISEARERGQVPNSRELATLVSLASGVAGLMMLGPGLLHALSTVLQKGLNFEWSQNSTPQAMLEQLYRMSLDMLIASLPWLALVAVAAVIAPLLLHGWLFTWQSIAPDFSRVSPLNGLKRLFSAQSAVELLKAVLKSVLIGGAALWVLWRQKETLVGLLSVELNTGIGIVWTLGIKVLLYALGGMLLVAAVDVPYQLWQYAKSLRMTKQEIKDEAKESEGDPQIKGRIRALQREAARRRMMSAIPKADVIVTNPTHYAVALQYQEGMSAPRVIAKGMGIIAERIMEIGREHRIPTLRTPPFARALYQHAELEQDIPAPLYTAAAEVLAYVYQLKTYQQVGGVAPVFPEELSVPADMVPPAMDA
ncbi:flagellar biosynthesis protein FlhB [Leeia sp.]|uniref:flagellar biosynthesis protein FlhB n=1 Tax=Leeia sp. TaxID=2884678 RepID=UPI0035B40628